MLFAKKKERNSNDEEKEWEEEEYDETPKEMNKKIKSKYLNYKDLVKL